MSDDLHLGAEGHLFWHARSNRKGMTEAEQILWSFLRDNQLHGLKFRRQHPINDFVADFYCHQHKLAIEVDGGYHNDKAQREYDAGRTYQLSELGITVVRFSNDEILHRLPAVLATISKITLSK